MRARRLILAALALGAAAACGRDARTPVLLYSPHGRDLLTLVEKTYERAHPDVDVRWLDMGSQEVYDRLRAEKANPQADVWYGGPAEIFARGAADGLLAPYRPSWAGALPPESRHERDLSFGIYRTPAMIVYNSAAVPVQDAPREWDDMLLPRWKGKVLIREPLASGTMRAIFGMVLARSVAETGSPERGFDWLRRLDAQTKEYVVNGTLLMEKIARREGLITLWDLPDVLLEVAAGAPLAYVFPPSGSPVIDDAVALVRGARHPEAAKALIEWLGSVEAQRLAAQTAYRLPARTDLPDAELPEWARGVLRDLVPARVDWKLAREMGPKWMFLWDREIRGKGSPR
ncbi:MAG: extracellular solute-binding protein [Thermoanaerobaculia bacterium]